MGVLLHQIHNEIKLNYSNIAYTSHLPVVQFHYLYISIANRLHDPDHPDQMGHILSRSRGHPGLTKINVTFRNFTNHIFKILKQCTKTASNCLGCGGTGSANIVNQIRTVSSMYLTIVTSLKQCSGKTNSN